MPCKGGLHAQHTLIVHMCFPLDLCYVLEVDGSAKVQRECCVGLVSMHNTL